MANKKLHEIKLENFQGLNNGMNNELLEDGEASDLQNIRFNQRGSMMKGYGSTDLALGTWPTGTSVLGMKFNSLSNTYLYVLKESSTLATFYEYNVSNSAWYVRGYTTGNTATTATAVVTDATATFTEHVKVGDYFKFDEDADTEYEQVLSVDSDTQLTLAADYGNDKTKEYTIKIALEPVNYNAHENPTLLDVSYWHSSEETVSKIYKWEEATNIITVVTDAQLPDNPKRLLSFKDRLWCTADVFAWDVRSKITALFRFNEIANADIPINDMGTTASYIQAIGVGNTTVGAGHLNNCRLANGVAGSYVTLEQHADIEVAANTDFTICFWLYITTAPVAGNDYVFCFAPETGTDPQLKMILQQADSTLLALVGDTSAIKDTWPAAGAWNFVWLRRKGTGSNNVEFGWTTAAAGVFDRNAKDTGSSNAQAGDTGQVPYFFRSVNYDNPMDGKLDQFMLCNGTALTRLELESIYNLGTGTEAYYSAGRSNRLYFSDKADFDNWTGTSYLDIPTNNKQQKITCITEYYDTLVIGMSNEIWTLYGTGGDPETDWSLKKTNSTVGMKENTATAVVGGYLAFVGYDGFIWAFDGNNSFKIGEKMDLTLSTGAQTMAKWNGDLYGIFDSGTYKYNSNKKVWTKTNYGINCLYSDGVYLYGGSNTTGEVFRLEETNEWDTATAIGAYWKSKWFDMGKPHKAKTIFDMYAFCEEQTHSGTLDISLYKDFEGTALTTFNLDQQAASNPRNGQRMIADITGIRGRHWQVGVANSAVSNPFTLNKLIGRFSLEEDDT